jgi:hypothetical protein
VLNILLSVEELARGNASQIVAVYLAVFEAHGIFLFVGALFLVFSASDGASTYAGCNTGKLQFACDAGGKGCIADQAATTPRRCARPLD